MKDDLISKQTKVYFQHFNTKYFKLDQNVLLPNKTARFFDHQCQTTAVSWAWLDMPSHA